MRKTVSWVQVNYQQGPRQANAYYLPYSAGVIWATCLADQAIKQSYVLGEMIWRRETISDVAQRLAHHDIVAFSTYVWNANYNELLARTIKSINPDCFIVFGGPQPAITDPGIFVRSPWIDLVVKLEGEKTFAKILHRFDQRQFDDIPGLLINDQGNVIDTGAAVRIDNLGQTASPYLSGVFDDIIAKNPTVEWNGTLETNRGCPYACTFCDWGSLTYNKIKKFDLQRVFDELTWMAQNRCGFVSVTDANFGCFIERDSLIVDHMLNVQKQYGWPKSFSIAWSKNQKKEVVDLVKRLMDGPGNNQGLYLSVQSLDRGVLRTIKRQNMEENNIEEIFDMCNKQNIPMFTELILGLPGDTLASWKQNFWQLYRLGNHNGITINHAQMIENSEMNLRQKVPFQITSVASHDYFATSDVSDEAPESVQVVTSTRHMSSKDMLQAMEFAWFQNTWHLGGLASVAARFAYRHGKIEYVDFYKKFANFLEQDAWWQQEREEVLDHQTSWMEQGCIDHSDIGGIKINGWNLIHRTLQNIQVNNLHDQVHDLLDTFMSKFEFDLRLLHDVMRLQKHYLVRHCLLPSYPFDLRLSHNVWQYIQQPTALQLGIFDYSIDFPDDKNMDMATFLDNYYYQRRRNFGKTRITPLVEKAKQ